MRKTLKLSFLLLFLAVLAAMVPVCGCGKSHDTDESKSSRVAIPHEDVEKVELLYFHPRFRCLSCNNVEKYATEVTRDDFAREMNDGRMVFKSMDIDEQ